MHVEDQEMSLYQSDRQRQRERKRDGERGVGERVGRGKREGGGGELRDICTQTPVQSHQTFPLPSPLISPVEGLARETTHKHERIKHISSITISHVKEDIQTEMKRRKAHLRHLSEHQKKISHDSSH